jgi:hypothetical protein
MLTIFVGSSSKSLPSAQHVVKILKDGGLNPVLWNGPGVFPAGDVTLSSLIDMSERCHGAVFVFGEDDEIYAPDSNFFQRILGMGPRQFLARDNVLIEYGLFVARLGSKKTIVYKKDRVKRTTDLDGITYLTDANIEDNLVLDLKRAYETDKGASVKDRLVLHVSTELERAVRTGAIPDGWYSRAMYIGSRGANAWSEVEKDDKYGVSSMRHRVAEAIKKIAAANSIKDISSIISFGPGVGLLDAAVVPQLVGQVIPLYTSRGKLYFPDFWERSWE